MIRFVAVHQRLELLQRFNAEDVERQTGEEILQQEGLLVHREQMEPRAEQVPQADLRALRDRTRREHRAPILRAVQAEVQSLERRMWPLTQVDSHG